MQGYSYVKARGSSLVHISVRILVSVREKSKKRDLVLIEVSCLFYIISKRLTKFVFIVQVSCVEEGYHTALCSRVYIMQIQQRMYGIWVELLQDATFWIRIRLIYTSHKNIQVD